MTKTLIIAEKPSVALDISRALGGFAREGDYFVVNGNLDLQWSQIAQPAILHNSDFGGPAAQIAVMHRIIVEEKKWISEGRFLHALNYCMLLPGPEAQQLATYIGWLMHRTWGGIMAGVLFVLPSLFILIGLSWVYIAYGSLPLVAGLFYGIKPAVTAIVLQAAHRIGSRALKNNVLGTKRLAELADRYGVTGSHFPWLDAHDELEDW